MNVTFSYQIFNGYCFVEQGGLVFVSDPRLDSDAACRMLNHLAGLGSSGVPDLSTVVLDDELWRAFRAAHDLRLAYRINGEWEAIRAWETPVRIACQKHGLSFVRPLEAVDGCPGCYADWSHAWDTAHPRGCPSGYAESALI